MPKRGESPRRQYEDALEECAAAEAGLEDQHLRHGVQHPLSGVDQPALDPEHEAAADRLDAAEGVLRNAYDHRDDSDRDFAAEASAMEKELDALNTERDALARLLDEVATTRDTKARERDITASGRDRLAWETTNELGAGVTDRFLSAVDRDLAAGDRAASELDRRNAADQRVQAAAARTRAADQREAARAAESLAEQRIDELEQSMEMTNTVSEAVGMIKQRHRLNSADAGELLSRMSRSEGVEVEVVAARISKVRWLA